MIQVGDWIRHRKNWRQWRVMEVREDGLLVVARRTIKVTITHRTIKRPEEYVIARQER